MSELMALSIVTGVLCGVWVQWAPALGILGWAGFVSCTTYFAAPETGLEGVAVAIRQNLLGVACAMITIYLSNTFPIALSGLIWSGFLTFIMCIMGKFEWFSFIPGTFAGSFSTFASGGDWKAMIPAIILGAFLGVACDKGGALFHKAVVKEK